MNYDDWKSTDTLQLELADDSDTEPLEWVQCEWVGCLGTGDYVSPECPNCGGHGMVMRTVEER